MKRYDAIIIGTGSAMNLVEPMIQENPKIKIAVIDKDEPGGICLTRGCIPSKILLYPAELVRTIQEASEFGLVVNMGRPDFPKVMARMRSLIDGDIDSIRQGLSNSDNIDYFPSVAEFTAPYVLKVAGETITSDMILLCTGSRAVIPPIDGLEGSGYITSDTALHLNQLPESLVIVGGGYIAAEFGHFFSAMGSKVTVVGRNARFIPEQEPEVSALAKEVLGKYMTIVTNHEVRRVEKTLEGKRVYAVNRADGKELVLEAKEVMIASGRGPTSDILHPERGGIKTTKDGWLEVDEYLQTSMRNVWAFGDADGRYLFKHVANYESQLVYYNAVLKRKVTVDYHAVPSAVFTYPEIARVGLGEKEAIEAYGEDAVLIGFYLYENTAKGEAINAKDYFVKVILEAGSRRILGAHIIGPYASILIQEVVDLMYTRDRDAAPLTSSMHIHPSMSEVVERAFGNLMEPREYHELLTRASE